MRTRHRPPSIFNLSMVDVLCCALGCVILLWLVNLREARQRAIQSGQTTEQLRLVEADRDRLRQELSEATGRLASLEGELKGRQADLDAAVTNLTATRKKLMGAEETARTTAAALQLARGERDAERKRLAEASKEIESLSAEKATAEDRVAKSALAYSDLEKKTAGTAKRVTELEGMLRQKETLADVSGRQAKDLAEKLAASGSRTESLESRLAARTQELATANKAMETLQTAKSALEVDLKNRDKELSDAKGYRIQWGLAEDRIRALTREIDERKKTATETERKIEALRAESARVRVPDESRFAGIALTGRRVMFLVDMSGSMERIDQDTPDPNKWTGVRQTVVKLLRSLPELEKFQVMLFAEKVVYPLGLDGRWIDYDATTSAIRVTDALGKMKPEGGTNMHIALDAAFRFRAQGLDTVYLLSDGLPNIGDGLPGNARELKEFERSEILSKYIRTKLKNEWNRAKPNEPRVRINTVGFFYESPDVGAFLWALARENDGSFVGMSKP